jgi:hypothetical protein
MAVRFINNLREKIAITLGKTEQESISRYRQAKLSWQKKKALRGSIRNALSVGLGVLSAGFGLKGFLMPNNFIDGGVTGISLLTNAKTGISPISPDHPDQYPFSFTGLAADQQRVQHSKHYSYFPFGFCRSRDPLSVRDQ